MIGLLCLFTQACDNKKTRAPIVQEDKESQAEANNVENMIKQAINKQRDK